MTTRYRILVVLLVLFAFAMMCSVGVPDVDKNQLPASYVPPGKQLYKNHCAACHGSEGKGDGPVASSLTKRPSDLTTLAMRNGGTFPTGYVANVLRFGSPPAAHGTSEMPVWGPIFLYIEHYNEAAVQQRIKNLCDFLASIQQQGS